MELIGSPQCGSVIVEMALALCGAAYAVTDLPWMEEGEGRARLLALNPLGQVPTLVLDDGTVLTESAAIILHLDKLFPDAGLLPPGGRERARAVNRMIWLVAAVYPTFTFADFPARWVDGERAGESLVTHVIAHRVALMRQWEAEFGEGRFACGERISALDFYAAAMTRWRPGFAAYGRKTPRLVAAARAVVTHPLAGPVFRRHWPKA